MKKVVMAVTLVLLFTASATFAATASSTMSVTANVIPDCSLTVDPMAFGSLDHTLATNNFDQSANIHYQCTNGTTTNVQLDAGMNVSGVQRRMKSGTNYVSYNLYQDAGRTTAWGSNIGTDTVSLTADGTQQTQAVYGRVPATGYPLPVTGAYADTVTVTFNF